MPIKISEMQTQNQSKKPLHINTKNVHDYTSPPSMHFINDSRQSSCSIKSTPESLNDFLDLYANDEDESSINNYTDDENFISNQDGNIYQDSDIETSSLISTNDKENKKTFEQENNINKSHYLINKTDKTLKNNENFNNRLTPSQNQNQIQNQNQNQNSNQNSNIKSNIHSFPVQPPTFRVVESSVKTTILHADSTIISDLDDTMIDNTIADDTIISTKNNNNNNTVNKPKTYTYVFDNETDDDNLGIDESILEMINNLGQDMNPNEELEIELTPEILDQLHRNKTLRDKSVTNNLLNNTDLISLEMSSEDEDYDEANRFKSFFGLESIMSNNDLLNDKENNNNILNHDTDDSKNKSNVSEMDSNIIKIQDQGEELNIATQIENNSENIEQDIQNLNPAPAFTDFSHGTSIDFNNLPEDPPPYCEIDEIQIKNFQQNVDKKVALKLRKTENDNELNDNLSNNLNDSSNMELVTGSTDHVPDIVTTHPATKRNVSSSSARSNNSLDMLRKPPPSILTASNSHQQSSTSNSPLKRKISIKLKKNRNGELSRHASVDFYHMDRYLPPYRSLINPGKVFDYRTNSYIDVEENDIEIREGDDNKPIVAIHKKKRDSKLVSILLTANNNIKQKILDVANDPVSIKSRSVSTKSIASSQHSIKSVETKSKPVTVFNDLSKEIHKKIIGFIDNQHDLVNCLYVSKSFNSYTIPYLYRYPKFTSTYRLGQFVHTLLTCSEYSKYVKILDLSQITFPVILTKAEVSKYQNKLIYGSGVAMELLNDKTRIIYAGWRDWKYRNHPLYGDFNKWRKRANSSSTISSNNSSTIGIHWDSSVNKSAPNLIDPKKLGTTNLVSSSSSNIRARSYSGSENTLTKASRTRSNSASNKNGHNLINKNKNNKQADNGAFVKSFKKAFGLEPITPVNKKKKNNTIPINKKTVNKTTTKNNVSIQKKKQVKNEGKEENVDQDNKKGVSLIGTETNISDKPFGTSHPKMNTLLKQYTFSKDIPAGFIIHIITECYNLEEINFNNITVSTDYELRDYETFDWYEGMGKVISNEKQPIIIDEKRPIFLSDCCRDMDMNENAFIEGYAESIEFKDIWRCLFKLKNIKILKLEKLNSLEMNIIKDFVLESNFKNNLRYLDCRKSGMVKRCEWDNLKNVGDWKKYFSSEPS